MKFFRILSAILRNKYLLTITVFAVWMLFFDTNDLVSQYQLRKKVRDLEDKKGYFTEKIEEVNKDRRELMSNPQLLEKFAREKYLMKRQGEEVFIIVDDDAEEERD